MQQQTDLADRLSGLSLFADLSRPQIEKMVQVFEEAWFADGERVIRRGVSGSGLFVIVHGEGSVQVDGQEVARLRDGDFFGEVAALLGEPSVADVVAVRPLRCLVLGAPLVERFLLDHPKVLLRMLQAEARRLRDAKRWRS
jgi:CRP-like cAMP-binding protein